MRRSRIRARPPISLPSSTSSRRGRCGVRRRRACVPRSALGASRRFTFDGMSRPRCSQDELDDRLTIWSSTQTPHASRRMLCDLLGLGEQQVRVVTPDVGGASDRSWCSTRKTWRSLSPHVGCVAGEVDRGPAGAFRRHHARARPVLGRIAGDRRRRGNPGGAGRARARSRRLDRAGHERSPGRCFRDATCLCGSGVSDGNQGGCHQQGCGGARSGCRTAARRVRDGASDGSRGARSWPRSRRDPPTQPGTGRAHALRNPDRTRGGIQVVLDSGDYVRCQRMALDDAGWATFRARQEVARREGRHIGIGLANYVEGTGRGPFEHASVRVGRPVGSMCDRGRGNGTGHGDDARPDRRRAARRRHEPDRRHDRRHRLRPRWDRRIQQPSGGACRQFRTRRCRARAHAGTGGCQSAA